MKKTFSVKLNTTVTIDFSTYGLSDAEQKGGYETRKLLVNELLEQSGVEEFEVMEQNSNSLFETMAEVVRRQNASIVPILKTAKISVETTLSCNDSINSHCIGQVPVAVGH